MEEVPYKDTSAQHHRIIWINERVGTVRPENVSQKRFEQQRFFGIAQKIWTMANGPDWFALTNHGDQVVLFRNGQFISLDDPPCTAEVRDFGVVSRFRLFTNEHTLMSFLYLNPYIHPLRLLDCTYDYFDRILDDLLFTMGDSLENGRWGPEDADIPLWRDEL